MISSGLFIALGLSFIWFKLDWKWRLWMNSNPVKLDVFIFIALYVLHMGTFSGGMAATVGALACSALLSAARYACGYYTGRGAARKYVRGKFNLKGMPA